MMIGIIQIVLTLMLSNVMPIKVGNYEIWSVKMDSVTEEKVLHNNWGPDMDVLTCSTLCLKDSVCNSFALIKAEVFYNVKKGSSLITSKILSKNF